MLKLRRVRAALAVRETGSALKAATWLHMSQPAVTEALAGLEADLGEALFERGSRGMVPTEAGRIFCDRAVSALDQLAQAERLLHRKNGEYRLPRPWHRQVNEGQLAALRAVVRTGSFTAAARRLGTSQPAVHRSARELQALVGITLWQRSAGGVETTEDARTLARATSLCFRLLEQAVEDLRELRGEFNGMLNIGALPLARTKWLPDAVTATLADYPQARVRIVDGPYPDLLQALQHGEIDVIVGALRAEAASGDVREFPLFVDRLSIIVRPEPPLARHRDDTPDLATLQALRWILPRAGVPGRESFDQVFVRNGLTPPSAAIECSSLSAVRGLLRQSDLATPLSKSQVEVDLEAGWLVAVGPPLEGTERTIGLAERPDFRPTGLYAALRQNLEGHHPFRLSEFGL